MKSDILLSTLLLRVREKTPSGVNMAGMLSDILCIGKEAVYRRLRGEVPFTFMEVSVISEKLGISLDSIVGSSIPGHILLHLDQMRFEAPRDRDFKLYLQTMEGLKHMAANPESELGCCANAVPISFMLKYRSLAEFKVFKWHYQYETVDKVKAMHEIDYPIESVDYCQELITAHRKIANSYYILDHMAFSYLVNHIKYFEGIHLIREEDVRRVKKDLYLLLDELQEIAVTGKFETGSKVQIYISQMNLEATYSYYMCQNSNLTLIKFFSLNSIMTQDEIVFEKMQNWIRSLKRLSSLISESGELQRVQFFKKQREIIDTL